MKLDITRAWKDETYRQSLQPGEQAALPVNPVGELTEADLSCVVGSDGVGGGGGGGGGWSAPSVAFHSHTGSSSSSAASTNAMRASKCCIHSFSLLCDINVFSVDLHVISLDHLIGIGESETRVCVNRC